MDFYEMLGVVRTASDEEIRFAYRRRAKDVHPDKGGEESSSEKMAELNRAKDTLLDPEKRAAYDANGYTEEVDKKPIEARNLLFAMFDAVLEHVPEEMSPVHVVHTFIDQHLKEQADSLNYLTQKVERIKRMSKRVKTKKKNGDNLFDFYATKKIRGVEIEIAEVGKMIDITELARVMLQELRSEEAATRRSLTGEQRVVMSGAYKDFFGIN